MIHRLADPNDPGCFLWSDGAGAAVLESSYEKGFVGAAFQADGAYASGWGIIAGGTFEPASMQAVAAGRAQMPREGGNSKDRCIGRGATSIRPVLFGLKDLIRKF